jgi:hypothetical protein
VFLKTLDMKKSITTIVLSLLSIVLLSQTMPVELSVGNRNFLYQHTIKWKLEKDSRFGFMHIANVQTWYDMHKAKAGNADEVMNQGYISFELLKSVSVLGGFFYTDVTGIRSTAALQFVKKKSDWIFMLTPRVDIMKRGSREIFTLFEYRPELTRKLKLYTRLQVMLNHGPSHFNRGYQRLRIGIDLNKLQFGFAQNLDQFGADLSMRSNTGVFLRKEFH